MSQQELLKKVVAVLSASGIEYMLTGSVASSLQGEPRSTHDIDLVVLMLPDVAQKLVQAFPAPDYFLSAEAIADAIRHRSMFNLLSLSDGEKVDFWILTDEPFDRSRFARRRTQHVLELTLQVSTPEDTILAKLRWAKLSGGSEKQFTDALRVFEVQGSLLDLDYLDDWASRLNVDELWQRLLAEAKTL